MSNTTPQHKVIEQINTIIDMGLSETSRAQMLEIMLHEIFTNLRVNQDIPVNTVTTEYHDEIVAKLEQELERQKRMRKSAVDSSNEQFELREKAEDALLDAQLEIAALTKILDEVTKPAEDIDPIKKQPKEIKPILQNAMVKGLVQTKEEAAQADADFDRVRMTKFYTDKELQTIEKMPKFSGHSLIKGKWIYIKQPPLNQLAADEEPFLNLRPKRPAHGSLNKNEVWQLRRYLRSGRRNIWIEERMGLSSAAVSQARTGKTYQNVPEEPKRVKKTTTVHAGEGVIDCGHPLN